MNHVDNNPNEQGNENMDVMKAIARHFAWILATVSYLAYVGPAFASTATYDVVAYYDGGSATAEFTIDPATETCDGQPADACSWQITGGFSSTGLYTATVDGNGNDNTYFEQGAGTAYLTISGPGGRFNIDIDPGSEDLTVLYVPTGTFSASDGSGSGGGAFIGPIPYYENYSSFTVSVVTETVPEPATIAMLALPLAALALVRPRQIV